METCCNPGCDQPGTNRCSACKEKAYCGPICQTADWPHHKEECPGHLRKVGMAHLEKAQGLKLKFDPHSISLRLRHADVALTKLKLLKDRPFKDLDAAFASKIACLRLMGRYTEAMENAKERYSMWAMTNIRHPNSIWAAFDLIECCLHLEKYVDAELFARTAYEIINERVDNIIPIGDRQEFLARGSGYLAIATFRLAQAGGIAPEAKEEAGVKAIDLARKALEIQTQLCGIESAEVANDIADLALMLDFFNDVDDDEVPRLYEQSKAIYARVHGSSSINVAATEKNLGDMYHKRSTRAQTANDLDLCVTNLRLALPRFLGAARIYGQVNRMDRVENALLCASRTEDFLQIAEGLIALEAEAAATNI